MLSKIISAAISGIEAELIVVETDISRGLPSFSIVGQADASVKEARERIRAALMNSGFTYPGGRITVNLSPADIRKRGSQFDLAIAMGILAASEQIEERDLARFAFIGELSLDGKIHKVKGALPMVMALAESGAENIILPAENLQEAQLAQDANIYPVQSLWRVAAHFSGEENLTLGGKGTVQIKPPTARVDFAEVKGQESAKRALTIAAAGGHGILMTGSPSTGKTMLAQRMPTILPPMTFEEIRACTMIYSAAGLLTEEMPYICERPFRGPHQSITGAGLFGGGIPPRPGEITLAHKGVLFLDEAGEFNRRLLDGLRTPLEKKAITLVRQHYSLTYPADFLLVAATNPCKCGYFGDPAHSCRCSEEEVRQYQNKLSGPVLERIDMHIQLPPVDYESLSQECGMTSAAMRAQVERARTVQAERFRGRGICLNGRMTDAMTEEFCPLNKEGKEFLARAYKLMGLSPRALMKIRRIARTIADIEGDGQVGCAHLAEAVQYRDSFRENRK